MNKEVRCAIYTRKSTEEGLEKEFNSLEAQRVSGESYGMSRKFEGWVVIEKRYDDGGYSGGSMKRPALQELLRDIRRKQVDCVIVYKIDRLSRSLMDFAKVLELFNDYGVVFVAVSQSFDTTSTAGRLMLNIMISFAQYEREMTIDRVKDKVEASKKKGMWLGGTVPLGFDVKDKKLVINEEEAEVIKHIFARFKELKSIGLLTKELNSQGYRTKMYVKKTGTYGGGLYRVAGLRLIITNPIYMGKIRHKDKIYQGKHEGIIEEEMWNEAQTLIKSRAYIEAKYEEGLLKGKIRCQACNIGMTSTYTKKKSNKRYRYYVCNKHIKEKNCPSKNRTIAAGEVERIVIEKVRHINAKRGSKTLEEIWENLFPIKQEEIMKKLLKNVWVRENGIEICVGGKELEEIREEYPSEEEKEDGMKCEEVKGEISLFVPCKLRREAGRCVLLEPENKPYTKEDNTLLKALVNAHLWQRQLDRGEYANITELCEKNKKTKYPHRILHLNLLAPKIKEDILNGKQPRHLKLIDFRKKGGIPWSWSEQFEKFYSV